MPVKKTKIEECCCSSEESNSCCMKSEFGKKIMFTLLGITVVYVIVLLGTMIRNNMQEYNYIGQADKMERTIFVEATAKVVAKPDIAVTTMGMVNEGKTVQEAQVANNAVMNKMTTKLKEMSIDEKDIQTSNYSIYPLYDYTDEAGRVLRGYEVRQDVTVKIRDLSKANGVLSLAGELGANSISGLQFTIDDPEVYKNEARQEALKKLAEKAQNLSQSLGIRLGKVVSYNEYAGNNTPYANVMKESAMYDLGGAVDQSVSSVESGSTEVNMTVSVTFQIK